MRIVEKLRNYAGLTLLEVAILMALAGVIAFGSLEYYRATIELKKARLVLARSRGNLGIVADELQRQMRCATHQVGGRSPMRVAATRDTLEIYTGGNGPFEVDTLRYYVNRFDAPPSLIRQTNGSTPAVFARGVDSVLFIAAGGEPQGQLSILLVATQADPGDTIQPQRLGFSVPLKAP